MSLLLQQVDEMLAKDIAELMKLIQREEAVAAQKVKEDGPTVKGMKAENTRKCIYIILTTEFHITVSSYLVSSELSHYGTMHFIHW